LQPWIPGIELEKRAIRCERKKAWYGYAAFRLRRVRLVCSINFSALVFASTNPRARLFPSSERRWLRDASFADENAPELIRMLE
jgi:hypothetical protein